MSNHQELNYLERKPDRTFAELLRLIDLRLLSDTTADDAKLFIAYREAGMFRRVLLDGITGVEFKQLIAAAKVTRGNQVMAEKELQPPEKITASLLALRDEIAPGLTGKIGDAAVILMKINSCLYSEYPVTFQPKE